MIQHIFFQYIYNYSVTITTDSLYRQSVHSSFSLCVMEYLDKAVRNCKPVVERFSDEIIRQRTYMACPSLIVVDDHFHHTEKIYKNKKTGKGMALVCTDSYKSVFV